MYKQICLLIQILNINNVLSDVCKIHRSISVLYSRVRRKDNFRNERGFHNA